MPKVLSVEEERVGLPIICLYGDEPSLQEQFIAEQKNKFRIILVCQQRPEYLVNYPDVYFLTYKDASLLPKLQETIDYALLFNYSEAAHNNIAHVLDKLLHDKSQIVVVLKVFTLAKRLSLINEYRHVPNVKFALMGELMSRKKIEEQGSLTKIIENVIINREITLAENNSASVFPISIDDALTGLSRLLFGNFKNNALYNIFYQNPQTVLATAHQIARLEEINILFSELKTIPFTISREEIKEIVTGRLRMDYTYLDATYQGFEKEFVKIFAQKEMAEELPTGRRAKKAKYKKPKGSIAKAVGFSFMSLFFGGIIFLLFNLLFFGLGLWHLKSAVKNIEANNFESVATDAQRARFFLTTIKPTANVAFDVLEIIGLEQQAQQSYRLIERVVELSEIAGNSFMSFLKTTPSTNNLASTLSDFTFLYREGQRVSLETKDQTLTNQLKKTYSKFLSFSEVLPIILGFDKEKNYLLLFQNDEELRPTGGFIGSIGELAVQDGKIRQLQIQDVYELDGQLKNHVEPPFIVRRYLQPHLYLRDSNFYLNFQEVASTSAYIYNLESGNRPDAVIALNLEVLRRIMRVVGPIELPEYKVTVNTDNISTFIQNTIKEGNFPGSTQKKDVLNKVFNQIVQKVSTNPSTYIQILKLMPDLMEEKNILFAFSDTTVQKIFSANNYAGEYLDHRSTDNKTINDFIYVNEANIGVNKVNAYVSREISYNAMVSSGNIASKIKLSLKNDSSVDAYTAYLTFVVPRGSTLKQITINNEKQITTPAVTDFRVYEVKDFIKPEGLEVEQYTKNNNTYMAFITSVQPNKKNVIVLEYMNGASKQFSTLVNYSLLAIKQPGTKPFKFETTIDYPEEFTPMNTAADSYGKNFLKIESEMKSDVVTTIQLQKSQTEN